MVAPQSEYEQRVTGLRARGETEQYVSALIRDADGDCRVALLALARRFDTLIGINGQLTDKLAAACTAINLVSAQLPAPPIPLGAMPYQHTTSVEGTHDEARADAALQAEGDRLREERDGPLQRSRAEYQR